MVVTDKGCVYLALAAVRDRWDTLTPDQRAEAAELVDRLSKALRREDPKPRRPLPLVGRISA